MKLFYQKLNRKGTAIQKFFIVLLAFLSIWFPASLRAEGFLSKVLFFQRAENSSAQKERTTKDLMRDAIDRAVFDASQVNGFYHEPELKIEVSDQLKKIEEISKKLRVSLFWHDIEVGLNRAAEKAAPKAGVLMKSALEDLQFEQDPEKILREEGSLTSYFRRKMAERLHQDFKREIERSVSGENALASYVEVKHLYASIPFVKNSEKFFSLEDELSRKALEGIFLRIQDEENRLRLQRRK